MTLLALESPLLSWVCIPLLLQTSQKKNLHGSFAHIFCAVGEKKGGYPRSHLAAVIVLSIFGTLFLLGIVVIFFIFFRRYALVVGANNLDR